MRAERFGHFLGDLDSCVPKIEDQIRSEKVRFLVLGVQSTICNYYILKLYKRSKIASCCLIVFTGQNFKQFLMKLKNHSKSKKYFFDLEYNTSGFAQRIKARPLLIPKKNELNRAKKILDEAMILKSSNPYVFLHARDSAFLSGKDWEYHSFRDFSAAVFIPIIKEFGKDFNFIRGGSVAIERMPSYLDNCIDLPFCARNDMVSVLAHQLSSFYFGSDSGVWLGSFAARKPVAMINFSGTAFGCARKHNSFEFGFIPKKIRCKKEKKFLGLKELYEKNICDFWRTDNYDKLQLEVVNNSDEEVREFFIEAIAMLKQGKKIEKKPSKEQEEFWKIVTFYQPDSFGDQLMLDNCRIGEQFLKRNSYLIS